MFPILIASDLDRVLLDALEPLFLVEADPDIVRHVLVTNADNYRKTPIARAFLEPILGRGLLTSEGSFWRRQRRIAAPAFHHKRIKA
ncbi:MAG: cytochrome P450, partial [Euryarchaeota archaeon]|nr:cytochrome P450 [Euryarchaeota archaeon]